MHEYTHTAAFICIIEKKEKKKIWRSLATANLQAKHVHVCVCVCNLLCKYLMCVRSLFVVILYSAVFQWKENINKGDYNVLLVL